MRRDPEALLATSAPEGISINTPRDPNTLSNYNNFRTTHTAVDFNIDFSKKVLHGKVNLTLKSITDAETGEITLDSRKRRSCIYKCRGNRKLLVQPNLSNSELIVLSYLNVSEVKIAGKAVPWEIGNRIEPYGSPLSVKLGHGVERDETVELEISSSTTEKCTALQWLTPEQTSNGKQPYMFSQCQAIHARSVFPCQDTPDVKSTFDFTFHSPLPVVASGLLQKTSSGSENSSQIYKFHQKVPIPSYLFAVASGDIANAPIGPRSEVWTGPDELAAAKWEFEKDMENYLETAEKLVMPYVWGTYNVLVLPPSFPYGGMENPIYTFATPTIVSGDRANVDVIAHELSHSWSGNLVSNASWEHFWLNEGWTMYLERRLGAALHGESHRDFSAIIGWKALSDSVDQYGADHEFTKLIPSLKGKDPDDAFSQVPYEKGFTFLYYLETLLGKEKWDNFIPHYFKTFAYKSLDSYDFKAEVLSFFANDSEASKQLEGLAWDDWFYKPGLPPKPKYDTSMVDVCYKLAEKWAQLSSGDSNFEPSEKDIDGWSANQLVVFLETLQTQARPLKSSLCETLGKVYGLTKTQNVEVLSRYYIVGLQAKDSRIYEPTAKLLGEVGRMKFVRPLFKWLASCDKDLALKTFEKNKDFYHPICRGMVEKDLFGKK